MAEKKDDTTTTTTVAQDDAGAEAPANPSNQELLDGVATASPHADRDPDTKVLGHEGKTPEESQEDAKREALHNAKGEQDLH